MTTMNQFLFWCGQFWHKLSEQWWPMLENQFGLLVRTLTASVPLTTCLSFAALICSCLVFRSVTMGGWRWSRGLLMILLFVLGMMGVFFVVHEV